MNHYSSIDTIQKAAHIQKHVFAEILAMSQVTDDEIIISHVDERLVSEDERIFEDQVVGTEMGALFATYLNIPLKAVYESLARDPNISGEIPEYFYSCPAIDEMLLGHHPKTYYFDISRGGPVSVTRRSMGYVKLAQEKHLNSDSDKMVKWVRKYGLGTCVPVMTFDHLVRYTIENRAKMYAVPATSVAESLTACAVYFLGMRSDVRRLTQRDDWMNTNGQKRNKGSLRIYEALHKYIVETKGQCYFKELISGGSSLTEVSNLYMEMAEREFLLGQTREDISMTFAEMVFDPQSRRSHPNYGAQADCSELVVKSDQILSPIPWELVILLGDQYGTSLDQLTHTAKLIKRNIPHTAVVILTDAQGTPLIPNYEESIIPTISDYAITAWGSYILENKIHLQKSQLMTQQSARR